MKKYILIILVVYLGLFSGCTTKYRWITSEGLPSNCLMTFNHENMEIKYCLIPDVSPGRYYLEGLARSKGAHRMGRIVDGGIAVVLWKGNEIVHKASLITKGTDLERSIKLHRFFQFGGQFDGVGFSWNFKYIKS